MLVVDRFQRPLEYLRISITDRCNFRCTYCMPAHIYGRDYPFIPQAGLLSFEEITRLARIFCRLGVNKIRLTGGEPLVRKDAERLVAMLASIDGINEITMTTNGYLLAMKAEKLKQAGLSRLNVSLDTLDPTIFRQMNGGRGELQEVLAGIAAAEEAGFSPLKINSVIQRGVNDHTLSDLALYFRERGHIVRFIEFMDAGTVNGWRRDRVLTADEMISLLSQHIALEPIPSNNTGEVVRRYRYTDGSGEVGFITSVSQPFCGGCTRLRLAADGQLYTCLFAAKGHDLRHLLRTVISEGEIEAIIAGIWRQRTDRYSEERTHEAATPAEKVEMFHIGG